MAKEIGMNERNERDVTLGSMETRVLPEERNGLEVGEDVTLGDMETIKGERNGIVLAGRYRVVKRLGEGGMGSVWLAEDMKLDGRKVAVKMLPSVLAGKKGAYRQVKAEALMAMKLAHPNIAIVRAFEEDEGGNPFLVMDYINGEPLDDILAERGPLSEEDTRGILGPVAAALDYAHSQGVVHRDVKPGNVMVRKDGTPFVLDFGIARELQETLTRVTGKLSSGTLLYMSPEQLNGGKPQPAQDVYSFAAMAYECLTGAPPFSRGQIEWQIMNNLPEDLPESVVGEELRQGIMAGLAKAPGSRPCNCTAVLCTVRAAHSSVGPRRILVHLANREQASVVQKRKSAPILPSAHEINSKRWHEVVDGLSSEAPVNNLRGATVTIVGYGEWHMIRLNVRIYVRGTKIGEVKPNEVKTIHIDGPCKLVFKCSFRSAECFVNGGDKVLLSLNPVTGSLRAIVTTATNYKSAFQEKQKNDSKWSLISVCLVIIFLIIKGCT